MSYELEWKRGVKKKGILLLTLDSFRVSTIFVNARDKKEVIEIAMLVLNYKGGAGFQSMA